jgi:hypothetical protein
MENLSTTLKSIPESKGSELHILAGIKKNRFIILTLSLSVILFIISKSYITLALIPTAYAVRFTYKLFKEKINPEYEITMEEIIADLENGFR